MTIGFNDNMNRFRSNFNKQIAELKKKLNETKDYKIFNQIQDLLDAFTDACMLLKMANDNAENAVDEANKNTAIESPKMTQAEYEKELQDKLEAEKAEKKVNNIKADTKILGSYVVPNRVKDCGKYFDLNDEPIVEEKAEAKANEPTLVPWHPLSDAKFNWMANEMPAIRKEFGNDAFVKLRLILQKVFGYDVENIFWRDTKIVKHKVQLNEASEYDIETCLQVGFSYLKIDDNGDYKTTKKQLVIKKRWFTIFTVDDLRNFPEFSDETVSEVKV